MRWRSEKGLRSLVFGLRRTSSETRKSGVAGAVGGHRSDGDELRWYFRDGKRAVEGVVVARVVVPFGGVSATRAAGSEGFPSGSGIELEHRRIETEMEPARGGPRRNQQREEGDEQ